MEEHSNQKLNLASKRHNPIPELWWFFAVAACVKLLLIPSYHSTDFEVHRHWLALTNSLPLSQWYFDETSPWTLDYPPFFAYFERFLSVFANIIDPQIVDLQKGLNYNSNTVVYFQRVTVIVSDLCLVYGVFRLSRNLDSLRRKSIWVLIIWSPMLVIVDHLHFQYNGFLLGVLLISLSYLEEGNDLMGGFVFAVLLCFKHLFAVAAPVFFVYLLRHYCWGGGFLRVFKRLSAMGAVVVAVFLAAYGPFVYYGQIQQVISRMFPFGRGLCHAYWAPNFWVFYIILDKGLAFLLRRLGFNIQAPAASFTGGLVGDSSPFAVLPRVTPFTTFIMVLVALSPCLIKAWRDPQPGKITRWVAYAYMCGFLFGWHVHEKASLHFVIPLAIVAVQSMDGARHYFLLSIGFSAIFESGVSVKKASLENKRDDQPELKTRTAAQKIGFSIGRVEKNYLVGIIVVEIWGRFLHPLVFGDKFPFIPLMFISIYCTIGIMYSWIWQLKWIVRCVGS
ncbi:Glycosyl transferase, ALG6/ALG [Trema orientale]|uniref:Alpha-1,3-glucosyltransferase n=1 Tax=Trema orientale TaxID=63057 RepID=A0A2P5FPQ3_TREOI|nr:Glycosyl transferase, ALG6/ALG [Trema orientale]